jgi:hypothetical protein
MGPMIVWYHTFVSVWLQFHCIGHLEYLCKIWAPWGNVGLGDCGCAQRAVTIRFSAGCECVENAHFNICFQIECPSQTNYFEVMAASIHLMGLWLSLMNLMGHLMGVNSWN